MTLGEQVIGESAVVADDSRPATRTASRGSGVVKAGVISMLALAAVGVTRLAHGSMASRATDQEAYGLIGSLLAITMIASLILPGGISSAMSRFVAFHRGAENSPAAWSVHRYLSRLALVSSSVLGVGAAVAAGQLFGLDLPTSVSVGLLTGAYSLYTVDKAAMYGHGLVAPYARLELLTSGLAITATVAVVVTGFTDFLLPLTAGYATFVVLARVRVRRHRPRSLPKADFDRRGVLIFTVLASVGTLASAGFLQGTQLLAGWFAAPAEVAHFAAAVALVAPLYFLPRAMALALFPAMSSAQGAGDLETVRRQVDVSTRGLAVLLAPVFVVALWATPLVLSLFGGARYAQGADVLRLMLCACFLGVMQVPAVNALASGTPRQNKIPVFSAVGGALLGLVVVVSIGGALGATGVGIGYLVGTAATAAVPLIAASRVHGLPWFGPLSRSIAVVAIVGAVTIYGDVQPASVQGVLIGAAMLVVMAGVLAVDLRWLRSAIRSRGSSAKAVVAEASPVQG